VVGRGDRGRVARSGSAAPPRRGRCSPVQQGTPSPILAAGSSAAADIRLPMKVRWDDGRTAPTSALNGDPPSQGATVGKNACSTRTSARHGTKPPSVSPGREPHCDPHMALGASSRPVTPKPQARPYPMRPLRPPSARSPPQLQPPNSVAHHPHRLHRSRSATIAQCSMFTHSLRRRPWPGGASATALPAGPPDSARVRRPSGTTVEPARMRGTR
jgi:hypothetical protein